MRDRRRARTRAVPAGLHVRRRGRRTRQRLRRGGARRRQRHGRAVRAAWRIARTARCPVAHARRGDGRGHARRSAGGGRTPEEFGRGRHGAAHPTGAARRRRPDPSRRCPTRDGVHRGVPARIREGERTTTRPHHGRGPHRGRGHRNRQARLPVLPGVRAVRGAVQRGQTSLPPRRRADAVGAHVPPRDRRHHDGLEHDRTGGAIGAPAGPPLRHAGGRAVDARTSRAAARTGRRTRRSAARQRSRVARSGAPGSEARRRAPGTGGRGPRPGGARATRRRSRGTRRRSEDPLRARHRESTGTQSDPRCPDLACARSLAFRHRTGGRSMQRVKLLFRLLSYWHAGTGMGLGPELDARVARSPAGLPILPGRTVKGLVRAGMRLAEECGAVEAGTTARLFGTDIGRGPDDERERKLEAMRFTTRPGRLRFESARLVDDDGDSESMERWAADHQNHIAHLYRTLSQTAIDAQGIARNQTLRTREVAVPLTLVAEVRGPAGESDWIEALEQAALFIHGLGTARHRGLGRVQVEVDRA
ncbi:MAG: hypothetical protein D6776_11565 [Planctomycetota bacterium]|nr:MAG: hypothetical protein D6776_11565 [Planctomycetota bacterium]